MLAWRTPFNELIDPRYLNVTVEIALQTAAGRPEFIERLRALQPGMDVRWLPETESTSMQLRRQLEAGALGGPTVLCTARQTGGRGTRGREWLQSSAAAGLDVALTLALPLLLHWQNEARLSLAIAACVAQVVEECSGVPCGLKWPNDLLLQTAAGWGKFGGLLIETLPSGTERWILCGCGLNINSRRGDFPPQLQPRLATLSGAAGRMLDLGELHVALVGRLSSFLLDQNAGALEVLMALWPARDQSHTLRYVLLREGQRIPVSAEGVDIASGALKLRLPGGSVELVHSYHELETA